MSPNGATDCSHGWSDAAGGITQPVDNQSLFELAPAGAKETPGARSATDVWRLFPNPSAHRIQKQARRAVNYVKIAEHLYPCSRIRSAIRVGVIRFTFECFLRPCRGGLICGLFPRVALWSLSRPSLHPWLQSVALWAKIGWWRSHNMPGSNRDLAPDGRFDAISRFAIVLFSLR